MVGLFFFRHTHSRLATLPNKQPRTLKTIFLLHDFTPYPTPIEPNIAWGLRLYTSLCDGNESFSSFHESGAWLSRNTVSWPRAFASTDVSGGGFIARRLSRKTLRCYVSDYCLCVWPFFCFIFQCVMSDWWRFCFEVSVFCVFTAVFAFTELFVTCFSVIIV